MKSELPLWGNGVMISPQHFQQQHAWTEWRGECLAQMALNHPWGAIDVAFEAEALKYGRLQPRHLHLRFSDGTLVDTLNSDPLPPSLTLDPSRQRLEVLLALPQLYASGSNCLQPDEVAERPVRYRQRWRDVRNRFGDDTRQIAVLQPELTLRYAHQDNSEWLTCPLVRLQQDAQGGWLLDETFLPPLLTMRASPWLVNALDQLLLSCAPGWSG